jgi:hypothetical protein
LDGCGWSDFSVCLLPQLLRPRPLRPLDGVSRNIDGRAKKSSIILTNIDYYDIKREHRILAIVGMEVDTLQQALPQTAKNSERTEVISLFLTSSTSRQPRVSAEDEMSIADKSVRKQQKQPDWPPGPPCCA